MKNSEILENALPKSSRLDLSTMHVSCNVFTLDCGLEVRSHYIPLGNYLQVVETLNMATAMIERLEADLSSKGQMSR
jgi:hypothetical protein